MYFCFAFNLSVDSEEEIIAKLEKALEEKKLKKVLDSATKPC